MDQHQKTKQLDQRVRELEEQVDTYQDTIKDLRNIEDTFRFVNDSTHDLIHGMTLDGSVSFTNLTWRHTLGYEEESLKLHMLDVIHPDFHEHCGKIFKEITEKGKTVGPVEAVFLTKKGDPVRVVGKICPRHVAGQLVGTHAFFRDITKEQQMQQVAADLDTLASSLIKATLMVSEHLDLDVTLKETLQEAKLLSKARYAAVAIIIQDRVVDFIYEGVTLEEAGKIQRCSPQEGLIASVIQDKETTIIPDIASDTRAIGFPEGHPDMKAYIGTPIIYDKELLGVIYLTNGPTDAVFSENDRSIIETFAAHAAVAINNARLYEKLRKAARETILRLSRASEYKDEDTGAHIQRMSRYSAAVARQMGLDDTTVEIVLNAAAMHDVGKIGTPDHILLKPGKLTPDDWEIMKQHAVFGSDILTGSDSEVIKAAQEIALTHQEKWDGSGYPQGLNGEEIPLTGRIVAIADVFDALTTKRPYKSPFSLEESFRIIREGRGSHFDPAVCDAFFAVQDEILTIKERYQDKDSLSMKIQGR